MRRNLIFFPILFVITFFPYCTYALQSKDSITVSDKEIVERLTRLEEGIKAVNQRFDFVDKRFDDVNRRIDDVNKRFDDLQNFMFWGFGILFAMSLATFGYIIWDRRTALQPLSERTARVEKLVDVLREYSRQESGLAEILKSFNLM